MPCWPSSRSAPDEISEPKAAAMDGPKKNMAVRDVSSLWVYHCESV